jgi:hypothetical protein
VQPPIVRLDGGLVLLDRTVRSEFAAAKGLDEYGGLPAIVDMLAGLAFSRSFECFLEGLAKHIAIDVAIVERRYLGSGDVRFASIAVRPSVASAYDFTRFGIATRARSVHAVSGRRVARTRRLARTAVLVVPTLGKRCALDAGLARFPGAAPSRTYRSSCRARARRRG